MTTINTAFERQGNSPMRLEHVDMLRGLAAGLVVCGHLRSYVFNNFAALSDVGYATTTFYGITALGHQAVIIFFAMSGFLVGGKALDDMLAGRWDWSRYLLRRLTRLLIVVVPALVATALFDRIGVGLTGGTGYDGVFYGMYASGPGPDKLPDYSAATFLGNMVFLQTIYVPIFGTNGPTWSLANEFCYYIVCPLAATIILVRYRMAGRLLAIGLLISSTVLLPWWLWGGGLIWIAGAAAGWLTKMQVVAPTLRHNGIRVLTCLTPVVALAFGRFSEGAYDDLLLGVSIAIALPMMTTLPSFGRFYRSLARGAAEISYSLYLTHFPFLTLIIMVELSPFRFQPSLLGIGIYLGLLSMAVAWAVVFWWCFERHTDRLFRYLSTQLLSGRGWMPPSRKLGSHPQNNG